MEQTIIDRVVKHYLDSHSFNGMSVDYFSSDEEFSAIKDLIAKRKLDLIRADDDVNCHIKRLGARPVKEQLEMIESYGLSGCLYPTPELLKELNVGAGKKSPYTRELMRGAPQLNFKAFDIRMLEWYRNDPNFNCEGDDIEYKVYHKADAKMQKGGIVKDNIQFFRFGFAYNSEGHRAIGAFLWDLYKLPYAHQMEMKRNKREGDYTMHPGFYHRKVVGSWAGGISIYRAFLEEKNQINKICKIIGKPHFFKTSYCVDDNPPNNFSILLRRTKKEFDDFALLLDKLLNDDIDRKFFAGDIKLNKSLTDEDGKEVLQSKGTIQLLEEWLEPKFTPADGGDLKDFFKNFRDIRKARNNPAHYVEDNELDKKYIAEQRKLISKAYEAVVCLRIILQKHPDVQGYKVPEYLENSKIWAE